MKKILVIGSNGYVGTALTEKLIKSGKHSVVGVDICWFDSPNPYTHLVMDYKNLTKEFLDLKIIAIFLLMRSIV